MKLAASNIAWSESNDSAILSKMRELGYTALEMAPTRIVPVEPYGHIDLTEGYLRSNVWDLGLSVCSMQSIWNGRSENIFDSEGFAALLGYTEQAFAYAAAIGCRNLVFGCPKNRRIPEQADSERGLEFLLECARIAQEYGVSLNLEANPSIYGTNFMNKTSEVLDVLEKLNFPKGLGINLDTGTMIANDESIRDIEKALPFVKHVHVSEPNLLPIRPRALHGELRSVLEASHYGGCVSLEMSCGRAADTVEALEYMAVVFL